MFHRSETLRIVFTLVAHLQHNAHPIVTRLSVPWLTSTLPSDAGRLGHSDCAVVDRTALVADLSLQTGGIVIAGQVTRLADADTGFSAPAVVHRRAVSVS